jgi:hypothetical protein
VLSAGSIASFFTTVVGLSVGMIALGGFVLHVPSVLKGESEAEIREATVLGGLFGLAGAAFIVVLSAAVE